MQFVIIAPSGRTWSRSNEWSSERRQARRFRTEDAAERLARDWRIPDYMVVRTAQAA